MAKDQKFKAITGYKGVIGDLVSEKKSVNSSATVFASHAQDPGFNSQIFWGKQFLNDSTVD